MECTVLGNWRNCLEGLGDCDRTQLNAQEQREVTTADYDHNLQNCLGGTGPCDQTGLSQTDQVEVARAGQDATFKTA